MVTRSSTASGRNDTGFGGSKRFGSKAGSSRSALGDISNNTSRSYQSSKVQKKQPFSVAVDIESSTATSSSSNKNAPVIAEVDLKDRHKPQYATEYVSEIFRYFREIEGAHGPEPLYMSKQTDINERMRAILIDWLVEVHLKFKLMPQTLYLTVNLLDRFLERKVVSRQKLQLVGCTAMLLASKYEEIYAPEVRDFVYISDRAFSRNDLLHMESIMLNVLHFNLTVPSSFMFLQRFSKIGQASTKTMQLASYYTERVCQEYSMLKYLPSTIAAASLMMAHQAQGLPAWSASLQRHVRYSEASLSQCVKEIKDLIKAGQKRSLQAVYKKYSSTKYMEVAKIPLAH